MARFDGNLTLCPAGSLSIRVPAFLIDEDECPYGNFSCQPVLRVTVRGDPMDVELELEPSQRKSIHVGVVRRESEAGRDFAVELGLREPSKRTTYETYAADLFYDGKNPSSEAELRLVPRQLAEVFSVSRAGTLWAPLGEVGGLAQALIPLLLVLGGVARWLQKRRSQRSEVARENWNAAVTSLTEANAARKSEARASLEAAEQSRGEDGRALPLADGLARIGEGMTTSSASPIV